MVRIPGFHPGDPGSIPGRGIAYNRNRFNRLFLFKAIALNQCKRFGAAVARWAHNPKVRGSKPRIAITLFV